MLDLAGIRDIRVKAVHRGLYLIQHRERGTNAAWRVYAAVGSFMQACKEQQFLVELDNLLPLPPEYVEVLS